MKTLKIDRKRSKYVDVILDLEGREVGMIRRGFNRRNETSPDLYFRGVGDSAEAVANVWPKGTQPEIDFTPVVPHTSKEEALALVAGN